MGESKIPQAKGMAPPKIESQKPKSFWGSISNAPRTCPLPLYDLFLLLSLLEARCHLRAFALFLCLDHSSPRSPPPPGFCSNVISVQPLLTRLQPHPLAEFPLPFPSSVFSVRVHTDSQLHQIYFIYFWQQWVFIAAQRLFSSCSERGLLSSYSA